MAAAADRRSERQMTETPGRTYEQSTATDSNRTADQVVDEADQAMYRAKAQHSDHT